MRTVEEAIASIERIEQIIMEMDEMAELMAPLIKRLLPISMLDDLRGIPKEGRSIILSALTFPDQFAKGIRMALGYQIIWDERWMDTLADPETDALDT